MPAESARAHRAPRLRNRLRLMLPLLAALLPVGAAASAPAAAPRNIIVMINDGAGWGTWDATAYWQYGSRQGAPYAAFPQRYGVTTYPLNSSNQPTGDSSQHIGYDPQRAWETTPVPAADLPFVGYQYSAAVATDSAAAGTALSSGHKSYNNAINVDNNGAVLEYSTLWAKRAGLATGVVTTVPFSHATPAAFAAQNVSRNDYHGLAHQMLAQGHLDLVMGAGGPGYSVNGQHCDAALQGTAAAGCESQWEFVAEQDWQQLERGAVIGNNPAGPWRLLRSRAEFADLASGKLKVAQPLIGVAQVARTLQQARQAEVVGADPAQPSGVRQIGSVPDLAMMTRGALAHLQRRSTQGLFLMIEGGATDWSAHTSACGTEWHYGTCTDEPEYGRLIEETADFNRAVEVVVAWIEANGGWEQNLLIVTTDHDNSLPMGPDAQQQPFQPVVNHGKGRLPGFSFRPTGNHSNALVPLWANGAGAELFAARVKGTDPGYRDHVGLNDGRYIDNTDVAGVVREALQRRVAAAIERQR